MDKEELMNMARSLGAFESVTKGGTPVFEFTPMLLKWFAEEILERAAEHFDERGKYEDGSWSEGFYEPKDPGEILRGLAEGKKIQ